MELTCIEKVIDSNGKIKDIVLQTKTGETATVTPEQLRSSLVRKEHFVTNIKLDKSNNLVYE